MPTIKGSSRADTLVGKSDIFGVTNIIYGYGGNDRLEGGFHASNFVYGGDGNDTLKGGTGVNRLYGETGNDYLEVFWDAPDSRLFGGAGSDTLVSGSVTNGFLILGSGGIYMDGGSGADAMYGGAGGDTFIVDNAKDQVIETWRPAAQNELNPADTIRTKVSFTLRSDTRIEILEAYSPKDTTAIKLLGNGFSQTLTGNGGNNVIYGYGGNDVLKGGAGKDQLFGGQGLDKLYGEAGNDILKGEAGNDKLYGNIGADVLSGGAGADIFVFTSVKDSALVVSGRDTISDFHAKERDKLDVSAIDANTLTSGNSMFSFISTSAFSKSAGELRYERKSADTYVYGDTNGDGDADFAVHLNGAVDLSANSFIL